MTPADFAAVMQGFGPPPARVAVALSGGPHSLALAWLARGWGRLHGVEVLALIAEHGLRPESAAEALAVRDMLNLPARILPLGLTGGPGLQERAREARLATLAAACEAEGAAWLLLGHHRMDQAETVLMRAAAGSGWPGLAGMAAARPGPGAWLLRPLLDTPPSALEAICAGAGLRPVRDPSNDDPAFARIRARHSLADPGGTGPRVAALCQAARAFARRRVALEEAVVARLPAAGLRPDGTALVDRAALGRDEVALHLLARLLRCLGGRRHAPGLPDVRALLERGHGTLAGAWWRRDGWLLREPAATAPPIPAEAGAWWDGRFRLRQAVPGCLFGALGGSQPRRAALPALWRDGKLLAAPHLGLWGTTLGLDFLPIGGPVDAVFRPMPKMGHSPRENVTYVM